MCPLTTKSDRCVLMTSSAHRRCCRCASPIFTRHDFPITTRDHHSTGRSSKGDTPGRQHSVDDDDEHALLQPPHIVPAHRSVHFRSAIGSEDSNYRHNMSASPFWSGPVRYLRWAAHERPNVFYSLLIGAMGKPSLPSATIAGLRRPAKSVGRRIELRLTRCR